MRLATKSNRLICSSSIIVKIEEELVPMPFAKECQVIHIRSQSLSAGWHQRLWYHGLHITETCPMVYASSRTNFIAVIKIKKCESIMTRAYCCTLQLFINRLPIPVESTYSYYSHSARSGLNSLMKTCDTCSYGFRLLHS